MIVNSEMNARMRTMRTSPPRCRDDRGIIYLVDRGPRFDVVEFERG